jgi:DNA modification methylase
MTAESPIDLVQLGDATQIPPEVLSWGDVLITDPPYSAHVHASATSQSPRRGVRHRDMGFEPMARAVRRTVARAAALVRTWSVIYSDVESSTWLRLAAQAQGATYIRTLPWVRWSMPQLSGDRPPTGLEHLLVTWGRQAGAKAWFGPGSLTHLAHLALRGETKHRAEKPLDQALDLVSWFSRPGDLVLDLFAGSGTVSRACQLLGRRCAAWELDPVWVDRANARLAGPLSPGERERIDRWLAAPYEDQAPQPGPSAERRARRDADREEVRAWAL